MTHLALRNDCYSVYTYHVYSLFSTELMNGDRIFLLPHTLEEAGIEKNQAQDSLRGIQKEINDTLRFDLS
jgi:hypothetical protein